MSLSIREMRTQDFDAVVQAVEQAGVAVNRLHVVHTLSLVACADDDDHANAEWPAAVLCLRDRQGGVALEAVFRDSPVDPRLARRLLDKALGKVQAAAIRSCRVHIHGDLPPESDPLSTGSNWFERFMRHHAA